ncbi:MAG: hypothetical protein CBC29_06190 [Methylococcaceae bacterium TMED69]|nr:MAG: hypothetical protein CBC29_06190 [Methylococcaceae bacterium TMED69]|tara:strand:- start:1133 stop:1369 length:237 start_codon:yes stop_codon:yes gene_type:complete
MDDLIGTGDLVVHIGASPKAFRVRIVCGKDEQNMYHFSSGPSPSKLEPRKVLFFENGGVDFQDQWQPLHIWMFEHGYR